MLAKVRSRLIVVVGLRSRWKARYIPEESYCWLIDSNNANERTLAPPAAVQRVRHRFFAVELHLWAKLCRRRPPEYSKTNRRPRRPLRYLTPCPLSPSQSQGAVDPTTATVGTLQSNERDHDGQHRVTAVIEGPNSSCRYSQNAIPAQQQPPPSRADVVQFIRLRETRCLGDLHIALATMRIAPLYQKKIGMTDGNTEQHRPADVDTSSEYFVSKHVIAMRAAC